MDKTSSLRDGTLLQGGKYRIVRFLGAGGFGCTYEAVFEMLGERVAVKEFFPHEFCNRDATGCLSVATDSRVEFVERLRRKFVDEARTLFRFKDLDGVVTVTDVFEENGTAYYVMDYVDGRSLRKVITADGPLPEAEALRLIREVGHALESVHARNCLHLDIKPDNIMLGADGHPILIDFGVSKQYTREDGCNTSTLMGCTPGYAPIEQMKGNVRAFLPATDIYALGATLYALVTGQTPPDASDLLNDETLQYPDSVSPQTRAAIEAAMNPKVKDRPQTVAAFLALLPGFGQENSRDSSHSGTIGFRQENSRDSSHPGTIGLGQENSSHSGTIGLGQENSRNSSRPGTQILDNKKDRKGNKKYLWIAIAAAVAAIIAVVAWQWPTSATVMVASYTDSGEYRAYTLADWDGLTAEQRSKVTPVGVQLSASGQKFIVAPTDAGNGAEYKWEDKDSYKDCVDILGLQNITGEEEAKHDFNGQSNTNAILSYGREHGIEYPAAKAASNYSVDGHSGWYLPAFGQLLLMYENKDAINRVLTEIGGSKIADDCYWSSTEEDSSYAWFVYMTYGYVGTYTKTVTCRVRAVAPVPVASAI